MTINRPALSPSYTPPEIAKSFRVDVKTVRQWISSGKLRAMNIAANGRPKYRVTPESLDDFKSKLEREQQATVVASRQPGRPPRRSRLGKSIIRG